MNTVKLTLQPDKSALKLPGFTSGAPLVLTGKIGVTVGELVAQLNTYRSPDSQIKRLWYEDSTVLFFGTVLKTDLVGIVKGYSC
jgi:hypothetical protein